MWKGRVKLKIFVLCIHFWENYTPLEKLPYYTPLEKLPYYTPLGKLPYYTPKVNWKNYLGYRVWVSVALARFLLVN